MNLLPKADESVWTRVRCLVPLERGCHCTVFGWLCAKANSEHEKMNVMGMSHYSFGLDPDQFGH